MTHDYETLVADALTTRFDGWDWSALHDRFVSGEPSWDYRAIVRRHAERVTSMLDLGTGGGELLASLAPLPGRTVATEGYPPNVTVARRNLAPLGVEVVDTTMLGHDQSPLPFPDASFELVVDRHESYDPAEVHRILSPDGWFVTQQVGGTDVAALNTALDAPPPSARWDLATAAVQLEQAGFEISERREEHVPATFHDIGAVVLFLRITPWQISDFTVDRYEHRLRALHAALSAGTPLSVSSHRFLLTARRP